MKIRAIIGSRSLMPSIGSAVEGVVKGHSRRRLKTAALSDKALRFTALMADLVSVSAGPVDHLRSVCWLANRVVANELGSVSSNFVTRKLRENTLVRPLHPSPKGGTIPSFSGVFRSVR
jgi:hypothetical protein